MSASWRRARGVSRESAPVLQRAAASPEGAAEFALAALADDDIERRLRAGGCEPVATATAAGRPTEPGGGFVAPGLPWPVLPPPGCSGTRRAAPWTWSRCGGGTRGPDARRWGRRSALRGAGLQVPSSPAAAPVGGGGGAAPTLSRLGPARGRGWRSPIPSLLGEGTTSPIVRRGAEREGAASLWHGSLLHCEGRRRPFPSPPACLGCG